MKDDNKEKSDLKYSDFENAIKDNSEKSQIDSTIKDKFIPEDPLEADCLILMVEIICKMSMIMHHKRLVALLKYVYEISVNVQSKIEKKGNQHEGI